MKRVSRVKNLVQTPENTSFILEKVLKIVPYILNFCEGEIDKLIFAR